MKRLNLHIQLLSFFVVMNVSIAQGMESISQHRKKSTKSSRKWPLVSDMKMFNLINDLDSLPIKYAVKSILSVDDDWITKDKNRQQLIEVVTLHKLDDEVACAVVEKLNDLSLAHHLAKQGKISNGVASVIVNSFLKNDISLCLHYLDSFFCKAFPGKILGHGNYVIVYKALMDAMTQDVSFVVNPPVNNSLSVCDFDNSDTSSHHAAVDSEQNFWVTSYDKRYITIKNLKNGITLNIAVPFKIAGLGFLNDNATSLCVLRKHEDKEVVIVHEFAMPLALLQAEIPLQHLAALVYCKVHVYKKTRHTRDCIGHTVLESNEYGEESRLVKFMKENLYKEWVPSFLKTSLKNDCEKLHDVVILRNAFDDLASKANKEREALAIELYIAQSHEAWNFVDERYRDMQTITLIENFSGIFLAWYGSK